MDKRTQVRIYIIVNSIYAANIALAFAFPRVAISIFASMDLYLMVRSGVIMGIGTCAPFADEGAAAASPGNTAAAL